MKASNHIESCLDRPIASFVPPAQSSAISQVFAVRCIDRTVWVILIPFQPLQLHLCKFASSQAARAMAASDEKLTRAQMIMKDTTDTDGELPDLRDLPDGGTLWKASLVLLHFLEKELEGRLEGMSVLELGSGSGHLGIELWRLGADVTCTERVAQDTLKKLSDRIEGAKAAKPQANTIRAVELEWGEDEYQRSPLSKEAFDFDYIIMSELVYDQDSHDELVATLQKVCTQKTIVYSIFCDRSDTHMTPE